MKIDRIISTSLILFTSGTISAQTSISPERLESIQARVDQVKHTLAQLPQPFQRTLSGGALNAIAFAQHWDEIKKTFGEGPEVSAKTLTGRMALNTTPPNTAYPTASPGVVPVSNPSTDFLFSVLAGFTQSETSTAWCGNNVVIGFNDSGSLYESLLFGPGGLSFSGASVSTDAGMLFRNIGFINPGPNPLTFLEGDPVVHCTDSSTFYYSQIALTGTDTGPSTAIVVSKSSNGGFTWADPVIAVAKNGFTHFLDKDWSAVDPTNPKNLYVTYTDLDFSFFTCGGNQRFAIEMVRSSDGGMTWSDPIVVTEVCDASVQDSQVVVDSRGNVFVEWELFSQSPSGETRELRIAKSTNHGASFYPSVKIDNVTATGDGFVLQGLFRTGITGNLAVDRSGTKTDGDLYVTWEDGRFLLYPDLESPFGRYGYANILISRSCDGGKTWSPPVRVNDDPVALTNGRGTDHFQPGVGVDKTGKVVACWYDRRADSLNYKIARFCGISTNGGSTWTNTHVGLPSWPPIHATDAIINPFYLGDYDTVVSDYTKANSGFIGAFGNVTTKGVFVPNQDVFAVHVE